MVVIVFVVFVGIGVFFFGCWNWLELVVWIVGEIENLGELFDLCFVNLEFYIVC